MSTAIIIVAFALFIIAFIKGCKRPHNFPPGPRGLPIMGYAPFMTRLEPKKPYRALQKLAARYGPVTGLYVGPKTPFIVVCGAKTVREALLNDDLIGRPNNGFIVSRTFGESLGLIFSDGRLWQEQRRFTLRHLRDLGFGKTSIEDQMMDEISELIDEMKHTAKSDPDGIVDFKDLFTVSVINILWAIIGGKRFNRDDEDFKRLLYHIGVLFKTGNTTRANIPVPMFILKIFPGLKKRIAIDSDLFKPLQNFIRKAIEEHQENQVSADEVARDFLDVYLNEINQQSAKDPNTSFNNKQLICVIQDLFAAGADTTTNSIGLAVLHLIHYQEIQAKIHAELDQVCGHCKPTLAHRSSLPYTEAFLMEVQRKWSIAPIAPPHVALRETHIHGYTIPKGSIISINLDSALNDPSVWRDPEVFRPERHLNEEGKLHRNTSYYLPFGAGKRMCLGEPLARNSYFLFVTALASSFHFKSIEDELLPTLETNAGITLSYQGFKAVVTPRI